MNGDGLYRKSDMFHKFRQWRRTYMALPPNSDAQRVGFCLLGVLLEVADCRDGHRCGGFGPGNRVCLNRKEVILGLHFLA